MGKILDPAGKLTDKQACFVQHYLTNGFNATRAAIDAGYSADTARVIGRQNLTKANVLQAIKARLPEIIAPERIKAEIASIADVDLADYEPLLDGSMTLKEVRESGVDTRQIKKITSEIKVVGQGEDAEAYRVVRMELHDRHAALEKLGRVLAMFTDRHEHTVVMPNVVDFATLNDDSEPKTSSAE